MKLIIAGSMTLNVPVEFIDWCINRNCIPDITEVVSGGARGMDAAGDDYARNMRLGLKFFPADWDRLGKSAGHVRNGQMAEYADALLLIWDGQSRGSANMKSQMEKLGKPIYEVILKVD